MDVSKIYIIDAMFPSDYVVHGNGDSLKNFYEDYHGAFSHIPFVHHGYTDCWEQGVPVIQVTNTINFRKDKAEIISGKHITVFLPNTVTSENAQFLDEQLKKIKEEIGKEACYQKLIYVKEPKEFGYDYECYPPMYTTGKKISFEEAISMFLRDAFHESSLEEKKMFQKFRLFDMDDMFSDFRTNNEILNYPINHNLCGVIAVDQKGNRYSSPVNKHSHQETMNYIFSCISGIDIVDQFINKPQYDLSFQTASFLFREGEVYALIPKTISKEQHDELLKVVDEMEESFHPAKHYCFSGRLLENGQVADENLTLRENIEKSYLKFNAKKNRGRVLTKNF